MNGMEMVSKLNDVLTVVANGGQPISAPGALYLAALFGRVTAEMPDLLPNDIIDLTILAAGSAWESGWPRGEPLDAEAIERGLTMVLECNPPDWYNDPRCFQRAFARRQYFIQAFPGIRDLAASLLARTSA